mmetsp:Transcript_15818/g.22503  ORF Transcript_15818/g.22503 Transcript_15818/m.22503 type:complete len:338 (-) Transcript_15818:147-1160(-)
MPTETTKLGGLLTALTNICEAPLPASPEKTYSDNAVQVVTIDASVAPQPASVGATTSLFAASPQPTAFTGIQNLTAAAATNGPSINSFSNATLQRSSKYKPAPPPYPPPGYYNNKEKFLDSDYDNIGEDSDEDEVQYFDSFESDEFDGASFASRSSSIRSSGGRGSSMLPTKKNARARARSLPSKLRPMPDDPPTRKYTKRKKSLTTVSTARPKLGGGGISSSIKSSSSSSKQDNGPSGEAILRPTPEDILAGRGGGTNRHDGNIRFRDEARKLRIIYKDGETDRRTKFLISNELVTRVRQYGGRFLEKGRDGRWYEMDELSARKKASQVLREEKWE